MSNELGISSPSSASSDSKYQYQRAINLSKHFKDSIYFYFSKYLNKYSSEVSWLYICVDSDFLISSNQRTIDIANAINILPLPTRLTTLNLDFTLASNIVSELQKIKQVITQLLQIPQTTYSDVFKAVVDLRNIITHIDLPVPPKRSSVETQEVKELVPLLPEKLTPHWIGKIVSTLRLTTEEAKGNGRPQRRLRKR
ncbi:hypothetical protein EDB19DRAFT_2028072 [Suillus lakei]|nr:hypothetical protein EDB19DRAFT_2028072 [Suillus lakei]